MRHMPTAVILFVLLVAIPCTSEGHIAIGAGTDSCGKWIESRNEPASHFQYKEWIFGFLSGVNSNSNSNKQSRPPDGAAVVAFIDQYCKNNPLHLLVSAADALIQETGGPKARHKWKQ